MIEWQDWCRGIVGLVLWMAMTQGAFGAAGSATYTYDDIGRITSVIYEDGTGQFYQYDDAGNRKVSYSGTPAIASFTSTSQTVTEPASGQTGTVRLTVTLTGSTSLSPQFQYQTVDGGAKAGVHYTAASGTLTFSGSVTSRTITITTLHHNGYDGPLSFSVQLQPVSAITAINSGTAQITINDADPAPKFSIAAATAAEGQPVTMTVTRANATSLTTSVAYATSDGSAVSGLDYTSTSGALSFGPGDTSKTFSVPTFYRSLFEANRNFTAALASPGGGAVLGTSTAAGTITDIDTPPGFAVDSPATVIEGSSVVFTVTASGGAASFPYTVNYTTVSGSAIAGTDFTAASGKLTFAANSIPQSQTVSVSTNGAAHADSTTRTFTLTLSNASGGSQIKTASGTGKIRALAVPAAPTLWLNAIQNKNFELDWTAPPGAPTTYKVYEVGSSSPDFTGAGTMYAGNLGTATSTTFYVVACNANGCGPKSASVQVNQQPLDGGG